MAWRLAKSLQRLLDEVNNLAPNRSKAADGTIGDAAHSSRTSDHNPNPAGIVCALDITHDPLHGVDSHKIAESLKSSNDPRIKYVISRRQIWNPTVSSSWRPYNGPNPHTAHVHISVKDASGVVDDTSDWKAISVGIGPTYIDKDAPPVPPLQKLGSPESEHLDVIWGALRKSEKGFGSIFEAAVKAYQKKKGLDADGKVGPYTWDSLKGEGK